MTADTAWPVAMSPRWTAWRLAGATVRGAALGSPPAGYTVTVPWSWRPPALATTTVPSAAASLAAVAPVQYQADDRAVAGAAAGICGGDAPPADAGRWRRSI